LHGLIVGLALASLVAGGCRREEEAPPPAAAAPQPEVPPVAAPAPSPAAQAPRVSAIELGRSVDESKRIAAPATSFAPTDTIYASVATEGAAGTGTLSARWTYQDGQLVNESSQELPAQGPAVTEFHISRPSGWPAGRYRLEIALNGQPMGSRDFEVRQP
jgi:hypothetical protein